MNLALSYPVIPIEIVDSSYIYAQLLCPTFPFSTTFTKEIHYILVFKYINPQILASKTMAEHDLEIKLNFFKKAVDPNEANP